MNETLYESAKAIKALMNADWQSNTAQLAAQMDEMKSRFFKQIIHFDQPDILQNIIELDAELEMPFDVIKATYERLFELGFQDDKTRHEYANYLLIHGLDWDAEANKIIAELEPEKATTNSS